MQKVISLLLLCFSLTNAFGQASKKTAGYLLVQYNNTIYDRTVSNNPWGMGVGLQFFFNNNSKLKATADLTADAYLEDDKVLRLYPDRTPIPGIGGVINLFAGASYHPIKIIYLSFVAGPSFVSGETLFGIKPSLGFYFSKKQKWTGKVYFINIYNRDKRSKEDFGSVGASFGVRLF